ncbi:FecCD family ABC transporter permease [Gordonia sp. PS3]|uniref:FecCD family ABC transporter permease n=1 Tax=Gordonia TaxID=2053 RepID=UPI0005EF903F|nr:MULTISPECIES: iron chelate uptake ABC transporter family permease subunit [Gordonia]KJR09141.1 iron ABC transporter permease [Gordonia sihwensis]KXT55807.1 iron ABC transporter permease [Gordonia sp. QH-12]WFN92908.1 iron chelate uptake ABC transporter family permease subunit [Gordonia sihwensis]
MRERLRGTPALAGWLAGLTILLLISMALGIVVGSADLPLGTVVRALGSSVGIGTSDVLDENIVVQLRLPRVVGAALIGAGLAVCGTVLQSLTGNQLADPYILGMSGGASLGAVVVLSTGVGMGSMAGGSVVSVAAFLGAMGALLLVFAIAVTRGGALLPGRLILAGVAVGQLAAALSSALIYFGPHGTADRVMFWSMGSVAGIRWNTLALTAIVTVCTIVAVLAHARTLDAFAFGERAAASLGTHVARTRWVLYALVSLCTAVLVALSGIIGFVGLVVPHMVRFLVGPLHYRVLPVAVVLGALVVVWADIIARGVMPSRELPLGLVTSVIGVPAFIYLLRRQRGTE